ncbi:MAG TPA: translation elongation factor Ts [Gammaproteobacteria bacterium]
MQVTASMVKELRERTGAGMMECKKALVETDGNIDAAIENMRKTGQAKADKKAGRIAAEGLIAVALSADGKSAAMVEVNCETDFVAKEAEFKTFVDSVTRRALEEKVDDADALGAVAIDNGGPSIEVRRRELVARIGENISLRRATVIDAAGDRLGTYVHGGRIGVVVDLGGGDDAVARDMAMHVAASRPLAVDESGIAREHLDKEKEILKAQVAASGKPPEIQEKIISGRLSKYLREVTLVGQPFVKDPDTPVEKYLKAASAEVKGFIRYEVGEGIEKKSEKFAEEVMAQARGG